MTEMEDAQKNTELLESLKQAGQEMTSEGIREQKVSFIMGSLGKNSDITREFVKSALDKSSGHQAKR